MSRSTFAPRRGWIGSTALLGSLVILGIALAAWKSSEIKKSAAAAANQPEPMETATSAVATSREYRPTITSVGTVLAMRSITLSNEIAGTVRRVALTPGQIVEPGALLVALDVSVEEAELEAQKAEAALAQTTLARMEALSQSKAVAQEEVDQARSSRDVAEAQMARTKAVIARKTIRAPFRARIGISDVHPGQYLKEGTQLTTLQGVADVAHVDFTVPQRVAAGLRVGDKLSVIGTNEAAPIPARIVAIDSRVDPQTRNATVRAQIDGARTGPAPGASVRVQVPAGPMGKAVVIPVSALRKGPGGDHVFILAKDKDGKLRAHEKLVRSGEVLGDSVLILDGVAPGDLVATSGSFKLRESVLVMLAADTTETGTAPGAK
ncbi:MAG TPA: efflux RND transporter periplasmic adaptor subunit [Gemmatimonadales bacterium]|jgi:membrane fusion protein (multidrug efflux system)